MQLFGKFAYLTSMM